MQVREQIDEPLRGGQDLTRLKDLVDVWQQLVQRLTIDIAGDDVERPVDIKDLINAVEKKNKIDELKKKLEITT